MEVAASLDWIRGEDSGVFGASAFEFSEPPLTLISAKVKSEEDSESSNSMRADSPTISLKELSIAMVGGVVSSGGAMEKGEIIAVIAILLKLSI